VAVLFAMLIGYACFRFGVIGDYFALVTLALGEVVALTIIASGHHGGSLGLTLKSKGTPSSIFNPNRRFTSTSFPSVF